MKQNVLTITAADKTPLVEIILKKLEQRDELINSLYEEIRELKDEVRTLKDEIAVLKKSTRRPKIKANKKQKSSKNHSEGIDESEKRPGSQKKSKQLTIHETKVIVPENLPEGAKLKRSRNFDVQDLRIVVHNVRYILEEWETPDGEVYSAQMPKNISQGHFGNELCSFILDQHHQCQVTQPLLHEQLTEFGIDISSGQLNNILTEDKGLFHQEKNEILQSGLKVSSYIQTDDTGARHDGKNGYCTQIGNEFFAWFQSSDNKSRINFLQILNSVYHAGYLLDENAFKYMAKEKLPSVPLSILKISIKKSFLNKEDWNTWLQDLGIVNRNHIRIATEGALFAGALKGGLNQALVILSDDAGQFNIPFLTHALCWIHEERHIKNLIPKTESYRLVQQQALDDFWNLYKTIKTYKVAPTSELKTFIEHSFDELFTRKTGYVLLDLTLKRIFKKKKELLVVLERTDIPLHNRLSGAYKIAKLGSLIEQAAAAKKTALSLSIQSQQGAAA